MTTVEPIRDVENLRKLENFLTEQSKRDQLFFTIGVNWGLRISDIVALNVEDVKDKTHVQIVEQKTGKCKKLFVNAKLQPIIAEYTKDKIDDDPLFMTKFGHRLNRYAAYYILKSACKTIGLEEHVGTHTMRKTFGYHHYRKFKDIAILQKIFNHSSPLITLRYIGIEQDEIDESYANFIL